MYKPDLIDWQIVRLLNKDGRLSCAEIARRLDSVSERSVKNRIDLLIKNEIIKVRSIVNPESVGYDLLADIFIKVESGKLNELAIQLSEIPQVSYVACATGDTDIIISVRSKDLQELYNFVLDVIGKLPYIQSTKICPLPLNIKSSSTWLPP